MSGARRALLVLAVAASAGGCARGCASAPPDGRVSGRVVAPLGSGTRVLVVDSRHDPLLVPLGADGAFAGPVPGGWTDPAPMLLVEVPGGGIVHCGEVSPAAPPRDVAPVAVWTSSIRVHQLGDAVRIDWAAIPSGQPGYPRTPRYSLLVGYQGRGALKREATFPSREARLEEPLKEVLDFLPERDPDSPGLELTIRCFDVDDGQGPWWIGGRAVWNIATGEAQPRPLSAGDARVGP